ncbi:uncharacterized protein DS421_18g633220 [Arachis hypogaea]|nr:uncharacterized protein DS421_18g633220 [Arachis hypogaea]
MGYGYSWVIFLFPFILCTLQFLVSVESFFYFVLLVLYCIWVGLYFGLGSRVFLSS